MFIKVFDEELGKDVVINTDHIIWVQPGDHSNNNVDEFHFNGRLPIRLPFALSKKLLQILEPQDLDKTVINRTS